MSQRQFADDSMTPSPINVSRDKMQNEIPSDQPMHDNTTPGKGGFNWSGRQYANDFGAGFGSYGTSVEDKGKSPSSEKVMIDPAPANRGKDS